MTAPGRDGEPCLLALDGGGSKTLAILVRRDASVAWRARSTGINPFDGPGWRAAQAEILGRVPEGTTVAAGLGLPGLGEDAALTRAQDTEARAHLSTPISLMNDVEMACLAAFAGGPGTLLLAGTGSMAWRRGADGSSKRVGGWGAAFGDEGSAYWIGRECLARISRALDGRASIPPSDSAGLLGLLDAVTSGTGDADQPPFAALMRWAIASEGARARIAGLAAGVDALAERGNATACTLLDDAAAALGAHLTACAPEATAPGDAGSWSYAGSVFRSRRIIAALSARFGAPAAPRLPPIGGGVLAAARLAGWAIDAEWITRLGHALADPDTDEETGT